jgi:hypothetical protein
MLRVLSTDPVWERGEGQQEPACWPSRGQEAKDSNASLAPAGALLVRVEAPPEAQERRLSLPRLERAVLIEPRELFRTGIRSLACEEGGRACAPAVSVSGAIKLAEGGDMVSLEESSRTSLFE